MCSVSDSDNCGFNHFILSFHQQEVFFVPSEYDDSILFYVLQDVNLFFRQSCTLSGKCTVSYIYSLSWSPLYKHYKSRNHVQTRLFASITISASIRYKFMPKYPRTPIKRYASDSRSVTIPLISFISLFI